MKPIFLQKRPALCPLTALLVPAAAGFGTAAQAAGLPTLQAPSQGAGTGILQTLQAYGYDIVMLVSLIVIASMFIGVCYHAYSTYSEIHTGRKTWGEFGLTVAVGALLLVLGIWLLTNATSIL
ncbi:MAG: TIGR03745 family integrating conjugative element membrane protein [Steroidobacteraceae bacterium]